jgi:6-pyruvoyltetrahydropterin/6-carboxytetrahydropterin synthase
MIVSKKVSFDAAHFLPNYPGKCHQTHGHHWVVELALKGRVMEEHGFVVDFSRIKGWLENNIVEEFDHTLLNDKIENPTAENIASVILEKFKDTGFSISGDVNLAYIRVWETENSMVELTA